jgi:hypothetical protein
MLDVAPPRSDSSKVKSNATTALFEARQDLVVGIYQESQDNHELKKSIAYLDSRISCLTQLFHGQQHNRQEITDHKKQLYGSLISALQTEPVHYARLLVNSTLRERIRLIKIACECLFQNTERDEYLLLTLIHVIINLLILDSVDLRH